ncbi:MAG: dTDP-4-dehydrorhamnose reductase [Myxococcales bacterium]|nr:dTDP-4-dehydrorhamnose reductase [Myxococcales bacterium]
MLGRALVDVLKAEGAFSMNLTRAELDITDRVTVAKVLTLHRPRWVINAAAYTNVDQAEREEALATDVNGFAVGELAARCAELGTRLLHVSTDYVFSGDGNRPYREDDPTEPLGAYGRGKRVGESLVLAASPEHLVVRTAWLYGPGGRNFARTILEAALQRPELTVVDDQHGCPTFTPDLAKALVGLLHLGAQGVVHAVASGETTWHGFASRLIRTAGLKTPVRPCATDQFPRPAPRPAYSVLDTSLLTEYLGAPMRPWEAGADDYVTFLKAEGVLPGAG